MSHSRHPEHDRPDAVQDRPSVPGDLESPHHARPHDSADGHLLEKTFSVGDTFAKAMRHSTSKSDAEKDAEMFYNVKPEESVYSYHTFMPPVERERTGWYCSWVTIFATGLVFLNALMQSGLLYVVNTQVIKDHTSWRGSIVSVDSHPWYQLYWLFPHQPQKCLGTDSLCRDVGGQLSCAPRDVQLLRDWGNMDKNDDGVWSRTEAQDEDARENASCEFGVDPLVVYEALLSTLHHLPALSGRLHPDVRAGIAVPKAYYDYYQGEALLCMYGDENMCGNIFEMGVLDGAIKYGANLSSNIQSLATAKTYCQQLSSRCKSILPGAYRIWKLSAEEKCGTMSFSTMVYDSPDKDLNNHMLKVDYEKPEEFLRYKSLKFFTFLGILLATFYLIMFAEWKSVYRMLLFLLQNPRIKDSRASSIHRISMAFVTVARLGIFIIVSYVGTLFLTSGTNYMNMIFDALSLVFIITVDELLYATVLRGPMKAAHHDVPPVLIHRPQCLSQVASVMIMEVCMILAVLLLAAAVASSYQSGELRPIYDALQCACLGKGLTCFEATHYSKAWWDEYWGSIMPKASLAIDALVTSVSTGAAAAGS